jgi:hypothetical protein
MEVICASETLVITYKALQPNDPNPQFDYCENLKPYGKTWKDINMVLGGIECKWVSFLHNKADTVHKENTTFLKMFIVNTVQ